MLSCVLLFATPWAKQPGNSLGQNTAVDSLSLLQGNLLNPGIKPWSPVLQGDSLPSEPQGKPKNTGVGNISLLQWIFLTQESNEGLLHCKRILNQLSYQEIKDILFNIYSDLLTMNSQPTEPYNSCLNKAYLTHAFYRKRHHSFVLRNTRQHFSTKLGDHLKK